MLSIASVAIDDTLHEKLKIKCAELKLKIKDVVNEMISDWLKKHGVKG